MRSGQWGAEHIGLLPAGLSKKCQGVGNGAIGGRIAVSAGALRRRERERERAVDGKLREVVKLAVPVTLADHEKFQDKFLNTSPSRNGPDLVR